MAETYIDPIARKQQREFVHKAIMALDEAMTHRGLGDQDAEQAAYRGALHWLEAAVGLYHDLLHDGDTDGRDG